jgi:hypothetical protein
MAAMPRHLAHPLLPLGGPTFPIFSPKATFSSTPMRGEQRVVLEDHVHGAPLWRDS